jgi:hypothetical protein
MHRRREHARRHAASDACSVLSGSGVAAASWGTGSTGAPVGESLLTVLAVSAATGGVGFGEEAASVPARARFFLLLPADEAVPPSDATDVGAGAGAGAGDGVSDGV